MKEFGLKEIALLRDKVNERVNIPFVGEKTEKFIFGGLVCHAVIFLMDKTGYDVGSFLNTLEGIDINPEVADEFAGWLAEEVDIPVMGEEMELEFFKTIILVIIDAVKQGSKLGAL